MPSRKGSENRYLTRQVCHMRIITVQSHTHLCDCHDLRVGVTARTPHIPGCVHPYR